jgi:organic hydroperoxide reductase OsmC/OhrA
MSELSIELNWQRQDPSIQSGYPNAHTVTFNDTNKLDVDAAPDWGGNPTSTNPEQSLAAALSSCYMMTFLSLSAKAKWPVCSFRDRAVAHLGKNPQGRMSITRIDLHPVVSFDDDFSVADIQLEKMYDRAHRYCFVANSLSESVEVNINTVADSQIS